MFAFKSIQLYIFTSWCIISIFSVGHSLSPLCPYYQSILKTMQKRSYFPSYERIFWIDQQLRYGHYPKTQKIAEHFEISTKTVKRTIEIMRDRMQLPIVYCHHRHGWFYSEMPKSLPQLSVNQGELVVMMIARQLLEQYGGSLPSAISQIFDRITCQYSENILLPAEILRQHLTVTPLPAPECNLETIENIHRALVAQKKLNILYYAQSTNQERERIVHPLFLHCAKNNWYLIAFDELRKDIRDFHLSRIRTYTILEESFNPPENFSAKVHIEQGFGQFHGQQHYDVEIIFDAHQARWIRESPPPYAKLNEMADQRLKISLTTTHLEGIKMWVLQYGHRAQVLAPKELKLMIYQEAQQLISVYEENP